MHTHFGPHIIVNTFMLCSFHFQLIFLQKFIAAASETGLYCIIGKLVGKAWNSNAN